MSRIKLKKCENYSFSYDYVINVRDINYGGHMGNDAVVGIVHEARINLLNSMGFSELDLGNGVTGLIMTDLVVNFISQGHLLDKLTIYSQVSDIKNSSLRIYYKIMRDDTTLVALVETGLVAFDYKDGIVAPIPDIFVNKLEKLQR